MIFDFWVDAASLTTSFNHELKKAHAVRYTTFIRQRARMQLISEVADKHNSLVGLVPNFWYSSVSFTCVCEW